MPFDGLVVARLCDLREEGPKVLFVGHLDRKEGNIIWHARWDSLDFVWLWTLGRNPKKDQEFEESRLHSESETSIVGSLPMNTKPQNVSNTQPGQNDIGLTLDRWPQSRVGWRCYGSRRRISLEAKSDHFVGDPITHPSNRDIKQPQPSANARGGSNHGHSTCSNKWVVWLIVRPTKWPK